ncbi:MAG: SHOCT domain-containing protein [Planctomycetes bacterium]|nr:SHOCT domain-containing protein [Planctomycetota bacterium]
MDSHDNDLCEYLIVNELSKSESRGKEDVMDKVERIKELKALLDGGAIDEQEYETLKSEVMNQTSPRTHAGQSGGAADKWVELEEKKFSYGIVMGIIGLIVFLMISGVMCSQMISGPSRMQGPPPGFPRDFP